MSTASEKVGALVMAGGEGDRMRRSAGADLPKVLMQVRGASMLERNLCALLGAGLRQIWVACRDTQAAIRAEVSRITELVRPGGVMLQILPEPAPLGTIGAAALLRDRVDVLLSVNADNLTALDLRALLEHHARTGADLTLAAHAHRWQLEYGELRIEDGRVTDYREKPVQVTRICSAICALGPAALAALDGPAGLPDLTRRLIERGRDVRAFEHDAAWIDVNEAADLARAAALVAAAPEGLECWSRAPDREVVGAVLSDGESLLLERRTGATPVWDTPGGKLERGEAPAAALARELDEELGLRVVRAGPEIARFDALEEGGRIARHHVFALRVRRADPRPCEGQTLEWFATAALPPDRARVVERSLACMVGGAEGEAIARSD